MNNSLISIINSVASHEIIAYLRLNGDHEMVDFLKTNHEFKFASVPDRVPYITKYKWKIEKERSSLILKNFENPAPIHVTELEELAKKLNLKFFQCDEYQGLIYPHWINNTYAIRNILGLDLSKDRFYVIGTPDAFLDLIESRHPSGPVVLLYRIFGSADFYYVIDNYTKAVDMTSSQVFKAKLNSEKFVIYKLFAGCLLISFLFGIGFYQKLNFMIFLSLSMLFYIILCIAYKDIKHPHLYDTNILQTKKLPWWFTVFVP